MFLSVFWQAPHAGLEQPLHRAALRLSAVLFGNGASHYLFLCGKVAETLLHLKCVPRP